MDCITFTPMGEEDDLRGAEGAGEEPRPGSLRLRRLKTGRVMVKDEDVCLHCGLCAERCPTGAWDMQKFYLEMTHAEARNAEHAAAEPSTTSSSSSPTSTARARPRANGCSPARSCAWACRCAAQHLPVEHPGPADLVRGARLRRRLARPARRRRPDGRDEPADLGRATSPRSSRAAICSTTRPSRCRASKFRDDITVIGVPLTEICNAAYTIRASASCSRTSSMSARCRAARHRPEVIEQLLKPSSSRQGQADRAERQGAATGRDWAQGEPAPRSACGARADKVGDRIFVEGNTPRRSAPSMAARRSAPGIRSRRRPRWPKPSPSYCRSFRTTRDGKANTPSCRPRTRSPRSAW
jgi:ferredoxin